MQLQKRFSGAWIAVAAVLLDRLSKACITALEAGTLVEVIPGVLRFRCTANTGIAFSLLSGSTLFVTVLTLALLVGLTAWMVVRPSQLGRGLRAGFWMIIGGGLGNLYDRIAYGAVIDFIELEFVQFAIFNVADIFICAGTALAVIFLLKEEKAHGSKTA